jgi:hypothetical protein
MSNADSEVSTSVPLSWIVIFVVLVLLIGVFALQFVGLETLVNPSP